MHRRAKLSQFLIASAVLIALASCSSAVKSRVANPENAILGKWREINGSATIQFFKEGTVILTGKGKTTTAYYKFFDEKHLKIEPKFSSKVTKDPSRLVKFSINQDQLTLGDSEGVTRFRRQN